MLASMQIMGDDLSLRIAEAALNMYAGSGSRGKPKHGTEWTHMAAICAVKCNEQITVLSMATGTKCLGFGDVNKNGFSVNDSHAEVVCRRAFVRFLFLELEKVFKHESSEYFVMKDTRACLKEDIKLHFFLTHTPCGDASIFPKDSSTLDDEEGIKAKRAKIEQTDIYRTGAKCVPSGDQDAQLSGTEYHTLGAFRTKPGRGDKTLSMSCSDKLSKWMVMGIQGSLASMLVEPLHLSSVILSSCPFSKEAFHRAIIERNKDKLDSKEVDICQVPLTFSDGRQNDKDQKPCPVSLVWYLNLHKTEPLVDGYKQGTSKRAQISGAGRSMVSRRSLFQKFLELKTLANKESNFSTLNYSDCKANSLEYFEKWSNLRQFYKHWIADERKLDVQKFRI